MGRFLDIAMPWADDVNSMDVQHAQMIAEFVRKIDAISVVEAGCCYGISTGAVLDALEAGRPRSGSSFDLRVVKHMHLIDPRLTESVRRMMAVADARPRLVTIDADETTSTAVVDGRHVTGKFYGDVVILDGDHSLENVQAEVEILLSWPIPPVAIVLHDSGRDGLPGPQWAVGFLSDLGWVVHTNDDPALGSRTSRGLSICATEWGVHKTAREVLGA